MKIGIAATTVHVPHALKLLLERRHTGLLASYDVRAFVTADEKTPLEAYSFCADLPCCEIYSPDRQRELGYACSDLLGWSTVGRRSIALLEAAAWGADTVLLWDDDNLPMAREYFLDFVRVLLNPFDGLCVDITEGWFDPGQWQFPSGGVPVCQRGFPQQMVSSDIVEFVVGAKVGVAQGMILGDPDTSAVDRISRHPMVHNISELYQTGVVVRLGAHVPVNSQNTMLIRELIPAFLMVPQFRRYDDIFAGLIAQRVMRERNMHVHLGKSFAWQSRNSHDLQRDLESEVWGMRHVLDFASLLDAIPLPGKSVLDDVRTIWGVIRQPMWMPDSVSALAAAWLDDCEKVMG